MSTPDPGGRSLAGRFVGRHVVLGVCGSISAYKAAGLASALVQTGALVDVLMTHGATRFVQPLTFEALTRRDVHVDVYAGWTGERAGHVTLARDADVLLIAPASANAIARLAAGYADDTLTAVALATQAPVIVAPAMEHHMWHHPATQANIELLGRRGVTIIPPASGNLASGGEGDGRLPDQDVLLKALANVLELGSGLAGRRVVVTAGGTREPLDPVRFLGNRSSGQMGVALAEAAQAAGASVVLIATASVDRLPPHMETVHVETALEMAAAVNVAVDGADVLVMAAAVADFRPATRSTSKIKKRADVSELSLDLVKTPDIVASIERPGLVKVGFAAETDDLIENAKAKLRAKGLTMIVANDAERTIGQRTSKATLLFIDRDPIALDDQPKPIVARRIVVEIGRLLRDRECDA